MSDPKPTVPGLVTTLNRAGVYLERIIDSPTTMDEDDLEEGRELLGDIRETIRAWSKYQLR